MPKNLPPIELRTVGSIPQGLKTLDAFSLVRKGV